MGISLESIILILVLALVLFGPEKLPEFAEKLGKWVAKMRQAGTDLTHQYHQAVNPLLTPPLGSTSPEAFPEITCPKCAQKFAKTFHFCPHCGHFLEDFQPAVGPQPGPSAPTICTKCLRKMEQDFLFCPGCGHNLQEERHYPEPEPSYPPRPVICPQCARQLDADFLFCPDCGQTLEKSPAPPRTAAH